MLRKALLVLGLSATALLASPGSDRDPLELYTETNLGASVMVVGHTVTRGVIEPRFGGRHISIDVGMLELYGGGHRVALEIQEGKLHAIHARGAVEIPSRLDDAYLARVAEVDADYRDSLQAPAASSR